MTRRLLLLVAVMTWIYRDMKYRASCGGVQIYHTNGIGDYEPSSAGTTPDAHDLHPGLRCRPAMGRQRIREQLATPRLEHQI